MNLRLLPLGAAAMLALAACEARFGNDADARADGNATAAGKAEEGRVSIHAPGFDLKIDIPKAVRDEAGMEGDSDIIYPNSTFAGIHVEGGRDEGRSDGEVEIAFTSADAPELVERWYRDPARAADFTVASAGREGAAYLIVGATADNDGDFRVRLAPRQSGGTDGRLLLSDRN